MISQHNYIRTDGSEIYLYWDGQLPEGMKKGVTYDPSDVPHFWPHLNEHCRYSVRKGCYVMAFSKQNLKRIFNQFGKIPVESGAQFITELKKEQERIYEIAQKVTKVKDLPIQVLPKPNFKIKPIGDYQHRGVVFLCNNPIAALFADCGCVAEDSLVSINTGGKGRKIPMWKLYEFFMSKRRTLPIRVRSFNGTHIQLHTIKKVVQSGIKSTIKVFLEDGKSIQLTPDHEVMTDKGFVAAGKLNLGALVMVDNLTKHKRTGTGIKTKKVSDPRIAVGKHHPFARWQSSHQGKSGSYIIEKHRAVYEAKSNGMSLEEFIACTYDECFKHSNLEFVDPKLFAIHHSDHNHSNNDPKNLEKLTHEEHAKHHTSGYLGFKHGLPEFSKVVKIVDSGKVMTYDIVCDDPHRNFVSDGVVVHNCGKTYMVLCSIEHHKRLNIVPPGKTLIIVKLATIETGWLEDCEKFTGLKLVNLWVSPKKKKRKEMILQKINEEGDAYVINHEGIRLFEKELILKKFEKIIIDESTILKNHRSTGKAGKAFGKALANIAEPACKWRVIMSGTPASNGPADLWGQFNFLDPHGLILEPKFRDFQLEHFNRVDIRPKHKRVNKDGVFIPLGPRDPQIWTPKKEAIENIHKLTAPFTFRVRMKDHLHDMPELTIVKRYVEMGDEQEKHYKTMEKELKVLIGDERILATIKITQLMKLRQITSGFIIDHSEKEHEITDAAKVKELDSLLEEEIAPDLKVVIYAQYQYEIKMIEKRYKRFGTVSVFGGNNSDKNMANIKQFREDPKIRIVILHPKSAAHGITFTMAHHLIFYSFDHSAEDNYQCVHRIKRNGQKHPMFVYYLMCKNSIDELIYKAIIKKNENQEELIDGLSSSKALEQQAIINGFLEAS